MVKVNFRTSDFRRNVADAGSLILRNRYFEENPFLSDDGAALLARPGMRRLTYVGDGPMRGMASEPGSFDGNLFVASGGSIYRIDPDLNATDILDGLFSPERGVVRMAITAQIGTTPEYLFIADGRTLFVYVANGYASNSLTGTPANTNVVRIDNTYYSFTNGSVDAGTPAGTVGNPWLVSLGASTADAFENFFNAVNASGDPGVDYSTALTENSVALATIFTGTLMTVRSKIVGAVGNSIVTTETGASLSWTNGGTMTGGGSPTTSQVQMPDDVGAIDVAVINSYVIVIPVQEDGYQGRFYWIEPGETTVDPLNFATAERSPDGVYGVQVFGDQFWLPGESTTEVWYVSGGNPADPTAPVMQRLQGVVLDRGSWQNTSKAIHENLILVDADGGVFLQGQGGAPKRVSTPDIEEEIRVAITNQNNILI